MPLGKLCSSSAAEKTTSVLIKSCAVIAFLALADLAIRAAVRLEPRWDTFMYHLPFSALRGGLNIPYEMNDTMQNRYLGFPPLPHIVQGILWKLTGTVNSTGIVNYLAFLIFLVYGHFVLQARLWLVALISLTAPLVIIHAASSYVDLFGNSLLAIGLSSCLYIYLFPEQASRKILICGLTGLVGAAWSKYQLTPIVALIFFFFALLGMHSNSRVKDIKQRQFLIFIAVAIVLSALPYIKNLVLYGNPFWPIRVPFLTNYFPYIEAADNNLAQRPQSLKDYSQFGVFIHSLFEINHPTHYGHRARWIIDQGNAWEAFRSGGFWFVAVIFYLFAAVSMLIAHNRKSGVIASLFLIGVLCFVAVLPQSHELRYYLFIPLSWAAAIGMLFPKLNEKWPRIMPVFLAGVLALFGYMFSQNWVHYRIEKIGYQDAAQIWGVPKWWAEFQKGRSYCIVDMLPIGLLLTGPTMTEYTIIDRSLEYLCPIGSTVVTKDGSQHLLDVRSLLNESLALYREGKYAESIEASTKALVLSPNYAEAYNNVCAANNALQKWSDAIAACSKAIALKQDFDLAKNNLAWAKRMGATR